MPVMNDDVMECITSRCSQRSFLTKSISQDHIYNIIKAGMCAPSGKNGQPWRFFIIQNDKNLLKQVANCTIYYNFVSTADCLITVFLDKTKSYNYIKDLQAVGACIENMLLNATALGIGTCWIGEILNKDIQIKELLNINHSYDLMAVVALGYPDKESKSAGKKDIADCIIDYR